MNAYKRKRADAIFYRLGILLKGANISISNLEISPRICDNP
jgi:hypothetical protein